MGSMNPTNKFPRVAAALFAASLCTSLLAQVTPTPTMTPTMMPKDPSADTSTDSGLAHHDRAFLKKAAASGMKEVDVSRAVMDRLSNTHAKDLAQMMITDHTAANEELMTIASNKGVKLPDEDLSVSADWAKKTGDIDSKYAKQMVSDHEEAVKLFEKGTHSMDPDIAAFARKTLPVLQHHLEMAQDLAKNAN
jgi:putative membrane protein